MRERSVRKDATWAFSVLERGAGGEGLYGYSFNGQNYGSFVVFVSRYDISMDVEGGIR